VLRLDRHKSTATVRLAGKAFRDGIGVEASSSLIYALKGGYKRLEIKAGISRPGGRGFYSDKTVRFSVYGDGMLLYRGGAQHYAKAPELISVPLEGVQRLELAARGPLVNGSDPRAAFWAEGRLYKAEKSSGAVAGTSLRAESSAGPDMRLSAFGEEGLLPEEYRFLREFIEDTGYQTGAELLITRNGAAAALDIAPSIKDAGGLGVLPHLSSWNTRDFPISNRTYTVSKIIHGISRKKPEVVQFKKTAGDPLLTEADRKKLESFLGGLGAWNRGDILLIEKEGVEGSLKSGVEDAYLEHLKAFEPEYYKAFQSAAALKLLEEFRALAGDRAVIAAGFEKCTGKVNKPCTTYTVQIPRARLCERLKKYLVSMISASAGPPRRIIR